jgi:hypothetical protein
MKNLNKRKMSLNRLHFLKKYFKRALKSSLGYKTGFKLAEEIERKTQHLCQLTKSENFLFILKEANM